MSRPVGPYRAIRCDCGWEGRTPALGRSERDIDGSLEQVFRDHLPAAEARTHLLVDSRTPDEWQSLDEWLAQAREEGWSEAQARAAFASQPPIYGTFVMPIGEPVVLVADRVEGGVHHGTYQTPDGQRGELPVGEVRTPEGRVFRLDE